MTAVKEGKVEFLPDVLLYSPLFPCLLAWQLAMLVLVSRCLLFLVLGSGLPRTRQVCFHGR